MPAKFTKAFAERLDRTTPWHVREAEQGDAIIAGAVLVAPGAGSLVVRREGLALKVDIVPQQPEDRYVPSVDRMLDQLRGGDAARIAARSSSPAWAATAAAASARSRRAGGRTVAEAPETAVIFGMPQEAIATGAVDEVVPLRQHPRR